ncbi:hypothetical protein BH10ACT1_BH10ACT1_08000 [soil metagenome]
MGVDATAAAFLGYARSSGVVFEQTLTIGRQSRFGPATQLVDALRPFATADELSGLASAFGASDGFAEPLFRALGAASVDALDHSDFEGANILHDLNQDLPASLAGGWTLVFDGGSTEHVFDFPRALEATMKLVSLGGHLITAVPANQQMGHGFYQVSPELYFRTLIPANGYEIVGVFLHEDGIRPRWYRAADPAISGRRLTATTLGATELFVCARRVGDAGLHEIPQQSDYAEAWRTGDAPVTRVRGRTSDLRQRAFRFAPRIGAAVRSGAQMLRSRSANGLTAVDLADLARASGAEPEDRT